MKVYFVRHGESELNASRIHQYPDTPLSEEGKKQAEMAARRFTHLPIDAIVASDLSRAKQTAETLTQAMNAPLHFTPLLHELKKPAENRGKSYDDPQARAVTDLIKANSHDRTWHYSDEENFYDLYERAQKAIEYLEALLINGKNNVLVVSHSATIRMIIAAMIFSDSLTPEMFEDMRSHMHVSNTGITLAEYKKEKWKLLTWNDYAHLGE